MTLSTHEDTLAWTQMFKFILGVTKGWQMAHGRFLKLGKRLVLSFCNFAHLFICASGVW